jgi:hypothetical protein
VHRRPEARGRRHRAGPVLLVLRLPADRRPARTEGFRRAAGRHDGSLRGVPVVRSGVALGSRHRRRYRPSVADAHPRRRAPTDPDRRPRAQPRPRPAPARPRPSRLPWPGRSAMADQEQGPAARDPRRHPLHHLRDRPGDMDVQADHQVVRVPLRRPGRKIGLDPVDALGDVRSHRLDRRPRTCQGRRGEVNRGDPPSAKWMPVEVDAGP